MAAMTNFLCVLSLAFLALAITPSAYFVPGQPNYSPQNPKPEVDQKPNVGFKTSFYLPKLHKHTPSTYVPTKPQVEKPIVSTPHIAIQGVVYCKTPGTKLIPIEGAKVKVTCLAVYKHGYESAPFSTLSSPTNKKGYFFTLLPSSTEYTLKDCRVLLEFSPLVTCKVPSDINHGLLGALLGSTYHFLPEKNLNLYSVGPFFYTPGQTDKPAY